MASLAQRRQYARHAIDLGVRIAISDECATQVAPLTGQRIDARLIDLSGGGAGVVIATYLPRGTTVDVETPGLDGLAARKLRAQVISVRMYDREPRYLLGLRFASDEPEFAEQLGTRAKQGSESPQAEAPAAGAAAAGLPRWMGCLLRTGIVEREALVNALRNAKNDEDQAGEWLVSNSYVGQRDLSLALAEGHDLPFVEPGDYRVHTENHKELPEELARAHGVFPLFVLERVMTLAVRRPLDLPVLDQIRLQSGCEVDTCLASPRELQHLVEWAYGNFHQNTVAAAPAGELVWADILKDVADTPVVKLVDVLLERAAGSRASDVHIDAEQDSLRVRFRVDGVLREVPAPPKALLPAIVSRVKVLAHLNIAETRLPQDGHFRLATKQEELDIRVSTLPSADGEAVVLRLLRSGARLLTLEELGMAPASLKRFDQLIHLPHGMLLVTGPTGSGKTTTLYSALARLDRVRQSIITLEDPVEVRLPQVRQVSVHPKAGLTFQSGLRAILRQDPDTIMLGEIRDRETAEIALQAALTGHIVLSTLHTNSAAAATTRLLDMGVPDFLVASSLVGVLAQRLCRRLCKHCARVAQAPSGVLESAVASMLGDATLYEAVGCKRCGHTGYEGRVGIFELLVVTDEIRRVIFDQRDDHAVAALAREQGMQSLLESGVEQVRAGETTLSELLRVVGCIEHPSARTGPVQPASERDREDEFDVSYYEHLLNRWLQPRTEVSADAEEAN